MLDRLYENDIACFIAKVVFFALVEAQAVCFGIVVKLSWWIIVLICIGVFVVVLLYRPLFEYVLILPSLGMIGFLVYSFFDKELSLPTGWTVFIIVWVVLYIIYMVFFSSLRESFDDYRQSRYRWY